AHSIARCGPSARQAALSDTTITRCGSIPRGGGCHHAVLPRDQEISLHPSRVLLRGVPRDPTRSIRSRDPTQCSPAEVGRRQHRLQNLPKLPGREARLRPPEERLIRRSCSQVCYSRQPSQPRCPWGGAQDGSVGPWHWASYSSETMAV